ncbi:hypothetical protein BDD12DRAFT_806343 [Trichophaea hybrida]|nr:hypothetical protein BDD12DRAFT_806343 [Trichophaea hybrida]
MPSLKSLLRISSWSNNKNSTTTTTKKRESPSPTPPSITLSTSPPPQNPNRLSAASSVTGRRRISSSASEKRLSTQSKKANEDEAETLEERVARKSHDSQPLWRTPAKFEVSSGGVPVKGAGAGGGDGTSSGSGDAGTSGDGDQMISLLNTESHCYALKNPDKRPISSVLTVATPRSRGHTLKEVLSLRNYHVALHGT